MPGAGKINLPHICVVWLRSELRLGVVFCCWGAFYLYIYFVVALLFNLSLCICLPLSVSFSLSNTMWLVRDAVEILRDSVRKHFLRQILLSHTLNPCRWDVRTTDWTECVKNNIQIQVRRIHTRKRYEDKLLGRSFLSLESFFSSASTNRLILPWHTLQYINVSYLTSQRFHTYQISTGENTYEGLTQDNEWYEQLY